MAAGTVGPGGPRGGGTTLRVVRTCASPMTRTKCPSADMHPRLLIPALRMSARASPQRRRRAAPPTPAGPTVPDDRGTTIARTFPAQVSIGPAQSQFASTQRPPAHSCKARPSSAIVRDRGGDQAGPEMERSAKRASPPVEPAGGPLWSVNAGSLPGPLSSPAPTCYIGSCTTRNSTHRPTTIHPAASSSSSADQANQPSSTHPCRTAIDRDGTATWPSSEPS